MNQPTPPKKDILSVQTAIENGIVYAKEALSIHDRDLGRNNRRNKNIAEAIERDIVSMELVLKNLSLASNIPKATN